MQIDDNLLRIIGREGYYVDVGANDGISGSVTYLLDTQGGWNGICIEAVDHLFKKLCNLRQGVKEHAVVAGSEKEIEFLWGLRNPENPSCGGSGMVDFMKEGHVDMLLNRGYFIKKQVRTVTLGSILEKHNAPKRIDFLKLDIEGAEGEVLSTFPFDKYTFSIILLESDRNPDSATIEKQLRISKVLTSNDYLPLGFEDDSNFKYIHKSCPHLYEDFTYDPITTYICEDCGSGKRFFE
jgi:FkbM family methyltransferase